MHEALRKLNLYICSGQPARLQLPQLASLCTALLDELLIAFTTASCQYTIVQLYQRSLQQLAIIHAKNNEEILNHLTEVLHNLQCLYPQHFNYNEYVVANQAAITQLAKKFKLLEHDLQIPLLKQAAIVCTQIIQQPPFNWQTFFALTSFSRDLSANDHQATHPLQLLVSCNIRQPGITSIVVDHYKECITNASHPLQCISQLISSLQLISIENSYDNKEECTLKDRLLAWLHQELHFFKSNAASTAGAATSPEIPPITSALSVAQLAAFLRLLCETRIIQCSNQTQLLSFIATHIKTKNAAFISAQSLRNKYYNLEFNARSSLKDICISLLNHARKLSAGYNL